MSAFYYLLVGWTYGLALFNIHMFWKTSRTPFLLWGGTQIALASYLLYSPVPS